MKVAEIILQQLGGRRFIVMTGASLLTDGGTYLSFKLPGKNFCKNDINYVRIELTPADTYTMIFSRIRGTKITEVAKHEDVHFDMLQDLFTKTTGLATKL